MPPPPGAESPVLKAPPPPGARPVQTDRGETGEPAEITAMRKASAAPFPPPPGAGGPFPPPPGLKEALAEASKGGSKGAKAKRSFAVGGKKKVILLGGGLAAILVLGGGFFAYLKLTEEPPPPPPRPKLAANPTTPQGQAVGAAQAAVEQAKAATVEPVNEVVAAETPPPAPAGSPEPAAATPEPAVVEQPKPEPPKPVAPPPPPPASIAFRAWVENLKIGGLRGGTNPRIFVGGISYQEGEVINPQLGIIFENYNDTTRMITFRDRSGAKVERRN